MFEIVEKLPIIKEISIHLMYRFNLVEVAKELIDNLFQYISCIGSIQVRSKIEKMINIFQYISCIGSIKKILGFFKNPNTSHSQNISNLVTFFQLFSIKTIIS